MRQVYSIACGQEKHRLAGNVRALYIEGSRACAQAMNVKQCAAAILAALAGISVRKFNAQAKRKLSLTKLIF